MDPSRRKKHARGVFDVHAGMPRSRIEKIMRYFKRSHVINLRPKLREKYPWLVASGILALILVATFGYKKIFTSAEVADFYPATCLGTWQNPQRAQGIPETFGDSSSTFSDSNSAILDSAGTEIYCGGFVPADYEAKGDIKNVALTLVWHIEGTPASASSQSEFIPLPEESSPDAPETKLVATSTDGSASPEDVPTSKQDRAKSPFGFLTINRALAHETDFSHVDEVPPQEGDAAANSSSEQPAIYIPLIEIPSTEEEDASSSSEALPQEDGAELSPSSEYPIELILPIETASTTEAAIPQSAPDDNFLSVSYSTDGDAWFELQRVHVSNWQNLTITLPLSSWEELKKFQVRVTAIPTKLEPIPRVFLDGFLVEVHYDLSPTSADAEEKKRKLSADEASRVPIIVLPPGKSPSSTKGDGEVFDTKDAPAFDLDLENLPQLAPPNPDDSASPSARNTPLINFTQLPNGPLPETMPNATPQAQRHNFFLDFFSAVFAPGRQVNAQQEAGVDLPTFNDPIVARVYGPDGKITGLQPIFVTANNKLRISLPEAGRSFKPGGYLMKLWVLRDGIIYYSETGFLWGVLVVNFNKSEYALGDKVHVGFGVLTDQGHTICDANIDLDVISPSGKIKKFSTKNNTVSRNETCGPVTVTLEPDYSATFLAEEGGTYRAVVVAETDAGARRIDDSFLVSNEPAYDVERIAPTRLYPPAMYRATLKVYANRDFTGEAEDIVPASFEITPVGSSRVEINADKQTISWPVDLKKGERIELSYIFKAPDISPELYKLGPLKIGSWQESREWQIAADAAGDIIMLWESTSTPSGWTCLSCVESDPFYGVFPRASSSYGNASSGGPETVGHIFTVSDITTSSAITSESNAGAAVNYAALETDKHQSSSTNNIIGTESILPPFANIRLISANTTTLPNGAIGIFAVSETSSLPANWTYYSRLNDNYLRAHENSTSTGGSAQHAHTINASTSNANIFASGATSGGASTLTTDIHKHGFSGDSSNASNTPPYVNVVFAQLTATTTLGGNTDRLIAMFDNTSLPTNWVATSSAGTIFSGNLLKGKNSFGAAEFATSTIHTHTTTTITTGQTATTLVMKGSNNTRYASETHTHTVTIQNNNASNSMPIYRDVILGQFIALPPTVSNAILNDGVAITLTSNATTSVVARA
ncbi:MAG: hypothetical protein AAB602_02645, partial [Patescibacteria group bacterium]